MFGSDVEVGVPFMRRVPPVTNPSAKVSGLHQANLLETTQPPGERLRLRNQLFTGRFAAVPKRNRDSLARKVHDPHIRHCQRDASRQIQVTGGRIERNGKLAERFAFVAAAPGWSRDQFAGILHQLGIGGCKSIRVVSDGDDGLRNFVQASLGKQVQSQLDWFHIGMRLERLRKAVRLPMTYAEFLRNPDQLKPIGAEGFRDPRCTLARSALAGTSAARASASRHRTLGSETSRRRSRLPRPRHPRNRRIPGLCGR